LEKIGVTEFFGLKDEQSFLLGELFDSGSLQPQSSTGFIGCGNDGCYIVAIFEEDLEAWHSKIWGAHKDDAHGVWERR
jgi:hypothetical protein